MQIIDTTELASYLRDPNALGDASLDLIVELANEIVSDLLAEDYTPGARARAITLEVAARAWRNPEGYSSETIDDYTYRRDSSTRNAGVYVTAAEAAELRSFTAPVALAYVVDLGTPYA